MRNRTRLSLSLAVAVAGLVGAAPADTLEVGAEAPHLLLRTHEGKVVSLRDLEGDIVVLEWTNPDCPYVQRHYREGTMTRLAEKYADQGVVWMAVNSTHHQGRDQHAAWAAEQGLPYPVLDDHAGRAGRAFGAMTTPHLIILDREGKVAYNGAIDDDRRGRKGGRARNFVDLALAALVAGDAPPVPETEPYGCSVKYAKVQ